MKLEKNDPEKIDYYIIISLLLHYIYDIIIISLKNRRRCGKTKV